MRVIISNIHYLGLCLIILACGEREAGVPHDSDYEFLLVDSVSMEIPGTVNVNSICVKMYAQAGREYLFWENRSRFGIELFDLTDQKYIRPILFSREGPNGIPSISGGFSVLGFDSIFVSSYEVGKLHWFDSAGVLKEVLRHADTTLIFENNAIGINSKFRSDLYRYKDKLILPYSTANFPTMPSEETVHDMQVVKIYDLVEKTYDPSGLHFDYDIYDPLSLLLVPSHIMMEDRYYYQIATQSAIRYTDDFETKHKKEAKSRYHTEYVQTRKYADPFAFKLADFSYRSLYGDPHREVIYRTVKLPAQDVKTADSKKEFNDIYERISIMILNKELDVLGETLFEHSNYSWNECFVGEKGFYILRSPYHPGYSESAITYDIYEWREKEGVENSSFYHQ